MINRNILSAKSRRDERSITVCKRSAAYGQGNVCTQKSPAWGDIISPLRGLEVGGGVPVRKLRCAPHTVTHDDAPAALNNGKFNTFSRCQFGTLKIGNKQDLENFKTETKSQIGDIYDVLDELVNDKKEREKPSNPIGFIRTN